jgi:hypothetical protein
MGSCFLGLVGCYHVTFIVPLFFDGHYYRLLANIDDSIGRKVSVLLLSPGFLGCVIVGTGLTVTYHSMLLVLLIDSCLGCVIVGIGILPIPAIVCCW